MPKEDIEDDCLPMGPADYEVRQNDFLGEDEEDDTYQEEIFSALF